MCVKVCLISTEFPLSFQQYDSSSMSPDLYIFNYSIWYAMYNMVHAIVDELHVKVQSESFGRLSSVGFQTEINRRRLTVSRKVYSTA